MSGVSFVKLFTTITDSSVWELPDGVRVIWITMLSMANSRGSIHASIVGIANRSRKTIADVEDALRIFMSPDPYSRTKDLEGRRIVEIDGGWRIVNYVKHRNAILAENVRESKRAYAEQQRQLQRESTKLNDSSAKVEESRSESNSCSSSYSYSPSGSDLDLGRGCRGEPTGPVPIQLDRSGAGVFDAPTIAVDPKRGRFAPVDFAPNETHRVRCQELRFDVAALCREFKAFEFNRDYSDWDRRFSRWIEDHRVRGESDRAKPTRASKDRPNQPNCGLTGFEGAREFR